MPFLRRKNRYCFGVELTEIEVSNFSEEEKKVLIHDIVGTLEKMMEVIMTRKSAKNLGKSWCGRYKHSHRHLVRDTIFVNLLTGNQDLPARPRDFRVRLLEEEKNIETHGLEDGLKFFVRAHLLNHKKENFQFPIGRPRSNSNFSEETRGRKDSFYEKSQIYSIVDNLLDDTAIIETIDNELDKKKLYNFLKYSIAAHFYQLKLCPDEFQQSLKPYRIDNQDKYPNAPLILVKDLTPQKIADLAKKYTLVILRNNIYNNRLVYIISSLMMYGDAYQ